MAVVVRQAGRAFLQDEWWVKSTCPLPRAHSLPTTPPQFEPVVRLFIPGVGRSCTGEGLVADEATNRSLRWRSFHARVQGVLATLYVDTAPGSITRLATGAGTSRQLEPRLIVIDSKLSLRDRMQAVVFAYESGLITPGATT